MLLAANDAEELGELLLGVMPSLGAYMRAALRLDGQTAPLATAEVIGRAAPLIGADPEPLLRCHEARVHLRPLKVVISDPLVAGYVDFVNRLVGYLDRIPH